MKCSFWLSSQGFQLSKVVSLLSAHEKNFRFPLWSWFNSPLSVWLLAAANPIDLRVLNIKQAIHGHLMWTASWSILGPIYAMAISHRWRCMAETQNAGRHGMNHAAWPRTQCTIENEAQIFERASEFLSASGPWWLGRRLSGSLRVWRASKNKSVFTHKNT